MQEVGRTGEKFVNPEPKARGLQIFQVFSQHAKWFIIVVNLWKVCFIAFIK